MRFSCEPQQNLLDWHYQKNINIHWLLVTLLNIHRTYQLYINTIMTIHIILIITIILIILPAQFSIRTSIITPLNT